MDPTYLGFDIDGRAEVDIRLDVNEQSSQTEGLGFTTYSTRATAVIWSFRLWPDDERERIRYGQELSLIHI